MDSRWTISNPKRWCCASTALNRQQIWKTQQGSQGWKRSVFISIPKQDNAKECSNYLKLHSSHTLAKKCSNFSKPGSNSVWTKNFQMLKLDLEKAEEPEIKLPTSAGSSKKQESSRKTSTSSLLTTPRTWTVLTLTVLIKINCGKFSKRWEYQTTFHGSWEICIHIKQQELEPDMEQWTGSKLG